MKTLDNNIDVISLLTQYNIDYKVSGKDQILCNCLNPYHDDSSPSMSIRISDGVFHCFGCGIKGGYAKLYSLITNKPYQYNNKDLWKMPLLKKTKSTTTPKKDVHIKIFGTLKDPLKNKVIRDKLFTMGILSDSFIKENEITYSEYTEMIAEHLLENTDISYTKMVNRICIPIYNENGDLVNVEGRTYKNKEDLHEKERKVLYVTGGITDVLYNWKKIDTSADIVVVEGIKDYWKVWNVYNNTVPLLGNILKDYQAQLLNSVTGNIILFLDNDEGGFGKYDDKGNLKVKGMLQYFKEKLNKDFKICYNPIYGKDPNDTDISQIKFLLKNAKYEQEVEINRLFVTKRKIVW